MSAPIPSNRVLPTLNADGSRRWIRPRLYRGAKFRARRLTAWALMLLFGGLPWLRIGGKPVVLLDLPGREFTLFGRTFLPTDGVLLMLLLLAIFVAVVLATALVGRAWCGWACPQTVYMEFLYRPIEWLFDGTPDGKPGGTVKHRGLRRIGKYAVFFAVSAFLGNTFLAYFVGTDALVRWTTRSPFEHPAPFLVMAVVTGLTFFDFAWFREQMCTVACPYARIQSVLLDRQSLIVGYDGKRGEPRSKGKPKSDSGDCIDCRACVKACPTGIDIRQGLQLECIACAQCVDACDSIMDRIKKPRGLIRYAAQTSLESGKPPSVMRPRVLAYAVLLAVLVVALVLTTRTSGVAEVTVLRGVGAPFEIREGLAVNQIRVKVRNRGAETRHYRVELLDAPGARLIAPENPLDVNARAQRSTSLFVMAPPKSLVKGERAVRFRVSDGAGFTLTVPYRLLGPENLTDLGGGAMTLGARLWPWVPVGLLACMLAGLGSMAAIAADDPGFALERDYYRKAVSYDREIAQRAENARLAWSVEADVGAASPGASTELVVRLRDEKGPVAGATLSVEALRNATAARVLEARLAERAPGEYAGRIAMMRGGLWELRLTAEREGERFTSIERRDVAEARP